MRRVALGLMVLCLLGCQRAPGDPLEQALGSRSPQTVEKALSQIEDVNRPLSSGKTPLWIVTQRHHPKAVALLLERGADPNVQDEQGRTLLDLLWGRGRPSSEESTCLGLLLKAGLRLKPEAGSDWFHRLAAACNDAEIPSALVSQGWAVDEPDSNGWTPLHHAVYHSRFFFCESLLKNGADVNRPTTVEVSDILEHPDGDEVRWRIMAGSHPLDLVRQTLTKGTRHQNLRKLLEEHGATHNPQVKNRLR